MTIQKLGASAWLALAEGKNAEALAAMREAADREDRTEKSAVTPGPLAPARELLGEMLLRAEAAEGGAGGVPEDDGEGAEPVPRAGRARRRPPRQAGDRAMARKLHAQLLPICPRGDAPGRPELEAAQTVATARDPRPDGR